MTPHGFARDMDFEPLLCDMDECWFRLKDTPETYEKYPFHFEVEIGHRLEGRTIEVMWKVTNTDSGEMLFMMGGHPVSYTHLDVYKRQAFAQTRTGYFNTVEVETILSLLSVVDNPMQDIPLAAVMRSPIVGMDDEEMAWMMAVYKRNSKKGQDRGVYGAWKLWLEEGWITVGLSGIPVKTAHSISFKSRRLSVLMERLRGEARHLPIHELLYRVYRESGYYDYVSALSLIHI